MTLPEEVRLTDEEKKLAIKGTRIDYFVDMAAKEVVDSVADAQLSKVQKWLESQTPEELRQKIQDILIKEFINLRSTHENAPPGHDCGEECQVDIQDQIAASNPIYAPIRSGGKKHKKCMDCWDEYIYSLSDQILSLIQPIVEQAKKEERGKLIELLKQNNVIAINPKRSLDELGCLLTMEFWQALKEKEV